MDGKTKKIIFFIVEGPTDENAFSLTKRTNDVGTSYYSIFLSEIGCFLHFSVYISGVILDYFFGASVYLNPHI